MSAGAVALGLAATASRTSSRAGSSSGAASAALPGAADNAASPSFADMLDKAAPTVSGNGHGISSTTKEETPSGQHPPETADDARFALSPGSPATTAHPGAGKRLAPTATATDRALPAAHPEAMATAGAATAAAAGAGGTRATGAAQATETTAPTNAAPAMRTGANQKATALLGASSTATAADLSGAPQTTAERGAPPASTETGAAAPDSNRDGNRAASSPVVAEATGDTPTAPGPAPTAAPVVGAKSTGPAQNASSEAAPALSSGAPPAGATALSALATPAPGSPGADPRQAMSRSTHSSDSGSAASPVASSPAATSAAAPVIALSRPAQSNAAVEIHLGPLEDPSLPQPGFVGSNSSLTAAISQPRNLGNGVYQLHAALSPPALGHVDATVKVDGTTIEVVLVAHTPEGHQQLSANLDQLRQALSPGGGGDVQLTLADRGRQGTPQQAGGPGPSAPDPTSEPDLPLDHLLVTTPGASARSSLHIIL